MFSFTEFGIRYQTSSCISDVICHGNVLRKDILLTYTAILHITLGTLYLLHLMYEICAQQ